MTGGPARATDEKVLEPALSIAATTVAIDQEFAALLDGSRRLEHLLALGRSFDGIAPAERREADRIRGCQSQLWLVVDVRDETVALRADSDALVMRGLLSLAMRIYAGRRPEEIAESAPDLLGKLVATHGLAPSRSGGIQAIVTRIHAPVAQFCGAGR